MPRLLLLFASPLETGDPFRRMLSSSKDGEFTSPETGQVILPRAVLIFPEGDTRLYQGDALPELGVPKGNSRLAITCPPRKAESGYFGM